MRPVFGLLGAIAIVAMAADPAHAVTDADADKTIGQHFHTAIDQTFMEHCLRTTMQDCNQPGEYGHDTVARGVGFTVLSIEHDVYHLEHVRVRLDDGRIGFIDPMWIGRTDAEVRREQALVAANDAKWKAYCDGAPGAAIGMSEEETRGSKWGLPTSINTTELANLQRAQWVYEDGPHCRESGGSSKRGYLYFDNGRLVAIQR